MYAIANAKWPFLRNMGSETRGITVSTARACKMGRAACAQMFLSVRRFLATVGFRGQFGGGFKPKPQKVKGKTGT